jgi:trehalose 6-phosphate phosphatase
MSLPPPPPLAGATDAVLLDFDGTLVDLVDRPDAVVVDEALVVLLGRLMGTFAGRVALVSGRSVAQIEGFLGTAVPGITLIGSHGAELRLGQRCVTPDRPSALVAAERALGEAFAGEDGVVIEVKSLGVAVHYRTADHDAAPAIDDKAREMLKRFVGKDGLVLQEGKMMIELRTGGHDKGSGISALLRQAPFSGGVPVFVGDDVTDEAGFVAVAAHGGFGVLVGDERPTAARYRLGDVAAVRGWLERAA